MSFVTMELDHFSKTFGPKGFFPVFDGGREIFFERAHERDPRIKIRVYTSISATPPYRCLEAGRDAVRVCLVYVDGTYSRGLGKTKRVNRTGTPEGVIQRALERAREMWKFGTTAYVPQLRVAGWVQKGRDLQGQGKPHPTTRALQIVTGET